MKNKKKETTAMKRCARKLTAGLLAGAMVLSTPVVASAGSWRHNSTGWWWYNDDWSYPVNSWKTIYGKDYHFNSKGYMDTYWARVDGSYYWFGKANDGAKKTYWQNIWGKWYWLGSDGAMRSGWQNVWGKTYYLGGSGDGAMRTGWCEVPFRMDKNPYNLTFTAYFGSDGAMRTGWQTIDGKKYYFETDKSSSTYGSLVRGRGLIDDTEYWFDGKDGHLLTYWQKLYDGNNNYFYSFYGSDGIRRDGWQTIWGKKYYFDEFGMMQTGWQKIDGDWYYFGGRDDGSLKTSTWIGKYWVDADGKWDSSKHNHEWTEKDETIEHPEEGHYEDVLISPAESHEEEIIVTPEQGHTETIHHDEEGHYEDVYIVDKEAVYESQYIVDREAYDEEVYVVDVPAVTETVTIIDKEAEYESQWVVDKDAYTETVTKTVCSICGVAKDK